MSGRNDSASSTSTTTTSLKVKDNVELIRLPGGKHKYMNPSYKRVQHKMYDYTCDIRLKVCDETFLAHKEVLSQASDYFAAMFSVDMREKEQECIEIYEISPKGFSSLLEYFYHGHITITTEIAEDIIEVARFFQVDWLLDALNDFLVRQLSIDNYYRVLELSDKYCLGDLRESIFHHIGQNFKKIVEDGGIETFSIDLLNQLLADDYFIDASEVFILQCVVDWFSVDLDARKEFIPTLLECIRFKLVDPNHARHLPEFILENPEVQRFIDSAQEYHENIAGQCLADPASTSARGSCPVVALFPADDITRYVQYKVPGEPGFFSQKTDVQELAVSLECSSIAILGNFLFVAGGYTRNYVSSRALYRYDPVTISWMQLSDMRESRVSFGFCSGSESLVAAGGVELMLLSDGTDQEVFLESVEQYYPHGNHWMELPPLPYKCYHLAVAMVGETIFICGGVTDNPEETIPINYCLSYSRGDDVWTPRSPMLIGRKGHSMTVMNNKIYVIGGSCAHTEVTYGDSRNNEVYDVATDQWTSISTLTPDFGHVENTAAIIGKKIYFICGSTVSRYLAFYDTDTDEFSEKEFCGMHLQKIGTMRVGLPRDFYLGADPAAEIA